MELAVTERSLDELIPLIRGELEAGEEAGREHYRKAGEMLIEAKRSVKHGQWASWLAENFDLDQSMAARYMKLARIDRHNSAIIGSRSNYGKSMTETLNAKKSPRYSREELRAARRSVMSDEEFQSNLKDSKEFLQEAASRRPQAPKWDNFVLIISALYSIKKDVYKYRPEDLLELQAAYTSLDVDLNKCLKEEKVKWLVSK